jgi:hypothetical protein
MPLPTRRAFRPDGGYYRTTRRQRLTRTADGKLRINPLYVAAIMFGALSAAGFYLRFTGHPGFWTALLAYGPIVPCGLSLALATVVRTK